jgi:anti-sigma regulatory factor (Ser/Thr protein kinase)
MDAELWILVTDAGCGHQVPSADPGLGWGLPLIAQCCDYFVLAERSDGGTEVRMRFDIG